jgi:tyrosine-protein kinase
MVGDMSDLHPSRRHATLAGHVSVLRRRKWSLLLVVVAVPLAACAYAVQQPARYRASSDVVLDRNDVSSAIANPLAGFVDPARVAATQVDVARSPALLRKVVAAADVPGATSQRLLAHSDVSPRANADVLRFSVVDGSPQVAIRLATAYAEQYTAFRSDMDSRAVREALAKVQARLDTLATDHASPLYAQLRDAQTKLETAETLVTAGTAVLRPASDAARISPRPVRALVLGVLGGIVLGLGLVYLAEAHDARVRSREEVEASLGAPALGGVPPPPLQLQHAGALVMLADPEASAAEAFRQLRTNLELASGETGARTILVTSALEREGKTTTAANLGVALARAGRRVVLVDLDLRRPSLHRFLDRPSWPGVTDVILGAATLEEALRPVAFRGTRADNGLERGADDRRGPPSAPGSLELLPMGSIPLDPGDLVSERAVGQLLATLRANADLVLVDTPPVLRVGDAMTLSAHADGLVVVFRLNETPRGALSALARELNHSRAPVLGFVATNVVEDERQDVGYRTVYDRGRARRGTVRTSA